MLGHNGLLMDDVHLLTARHFCGGKIFSSKFGAREVCIAPQNGLPPFINIRYDARAKAEINYTCERFDY